MASWDDEDEELQAVTTKTVNDKWAGEDEEDVLESWDAEENEQTTEDKTVNGTAAGDKKKKSLAEKIAEREERKRLEVEEKKRLLAEESREVSEAERERRAEEAEFFLLKDTFGANESQPALSQRSIDQSNPKNKEEFDELSDLLKDKLLKFNTSPHFSSFLDSLFRELVVGVEADDLRKLSTTFNAMASEKQKMQKTAKGKKKAVKGKIAVVRNNDLNAYDGEEAALDDDFDDFI